MRHLGVVLTVLAALLGCGEDASLSGPAAPETAPEPAGESAPRPFPEELEHALHLGQRQDFEAAHEIADAWLAAHPDDPQGVLVKGLTFHRARDYAAAEPLLTRSLELDPTNLVVHHFLGYCRFYRGDLAGARVAFETHLRSAPDESDSHFGVGLVALEEGRLEEAKGRFLHAILIITALETEDPDLYRLRHGDLAKCHARLADIAFAREQYVDARGLLHRAIEVDPNQYASYYVLAQVERRLGNDAEADRLHGLYEQMAARRERDRQDSP